MDAGEASIVRGADAALAELAAKWLRACAERDAAYVEEHSVAEPAEAFRCIGSAGEPFPLRAFADHLRGLRPAGWSGLAPEGWVRGDTAWFTGSAQGLLPSGEPLRIRISLLMLRLEGAWKTVHCHVSEGVEREGLTLDA